MVLIVVVTMVMTLAPRAGMLRFLLMLGLLLALMWMMMPILVLMILLPLKTSNHKPLP